MARLRFVLHAFVGEERAPRTTTCGQIPRDCQVGSMPVRECAPSRVVSPRLFAPNCPLSVALATRFPLPPFTVPSDKQLTKRIR